MQENCKKLQLFIDGDTERHPYKPRHVMTCSQKYWEVLLTGTINGAGALGNEEGRLLSQGAGPAPDAWLSPESLL